LFFQNLPDVEGAPQIFSETGVFLEFSGSHCDLLDF